MGMPILDPIVAIFIALLVLKTAFKVGRENISSIMGKVPSQEILNDIKAAALSVEGVQGIHDVRVNYMGPYASVELHVDAMGDLNLKEAHDIAHQVEENIIENVDVVAMVGVHVCPVDEHGDFCID
ncbi:MAG: cation diffusion facilitator family transporter [Euryarchaeota archaeon]|nr:cation diffusion facilitator family transporter [Euryarchaeota archaeon]